MKSPLNSVKTCERIIKIQYRLIINFTLTKASSLIHPEINSSSVREPFPSSSKALNNSLECFVKSWKNTNHPDIKKKINLEGRMGMVLIYLSFDFSE